MTLAASRVREAFEGYAQLSRMTYPGEVSEWRADRSGGVRWRLQQSASFGWNKMVFGLAGREGANALMTVANFADGKTPYARGWCCATPTRRWAPISTPAASR